MATFFCSTYNKHVAMFLKSHRISLNKKLAEVRLTHEPCRLRQNHVIIHSGIRFSENVELLFTVNLSTIFRERIKWSREGSLANQMSQFLFLHTLLWKLGSGPL
jgi:hypothetical protein